MLEAAREAGFQNVRGIDEASAAVSTVLCQSTDDRLLRSDKPGYLMLIDMGAGTTDLVVCRYEANPGGDGINSKLPLHLAKPEPKEETKLTEESKPKEEKKQAEANVTDHNAQSREKTAESSRNAQSKRSAVQGGSAAYDVLLSAAEAFLDRNSMDGRSIINRRGKRSLLQQIKVCDAAHPGCWIYRFYETGMFINDLQLWITSRGIYYGVSMFPLPDNDEFFEARAKELIPQPVKLASCNFLSWERFLDGRWHRLGGLIEAEEMQDYLEKLEVHLNRECAGMGLLSTDAALRWDDRLLPRIKEFIATYDKPLTEKFIVKPTDEFIERIRSRMYYGEKRTYSVEFYVGFDVSISWRDEFFILTNQGITCNISDNHHTSWPFFLEADAIRRDGNYVYCCHTERLPFPLEVCIGCAGNHEISEQFDRFYRELHAYLRKCAAEL